MKPKLSTALGLLLLIIFCGMLSCELRDRRTETFPPPPPAGPRAPRLVGTLENIRGAGNAYYQPGNRGPSTRAHEGQRVYEGDRIYTGPNTQMTLRLIQGGYAELAAETDPTPRFLEDLRCLIIDLFLSGTMFVDGNNICVGAQGTVTKQDSQVVYDLRSSSVQITVISGRAELRRPQILPISPGFRVDANSRQVLKGGKPYPLTRLQVEEAVRFTNWYQRMRPALPGRDVIK